MPKNFSTVDSDSMNSLYAMLLDCQTVHLNQHLHTTNPALPQEHLLEIFLCSIVCVQFRLSFRMQTLLCIEDLNEYRYHIDRMMQILKNKGVLSSLSGLIVGEMLNMKQGSDPHILE